MLYHSSTPEAIDNILKNGFQKIENWPGSLNFLYSSKKVNYLGNFGIGTYAFLNNPQLSNFFIKKELKSSSNKEYKTIEFNLYKTIEENGKKRKVNVLDLCPNSEDLVYFQNYVKKYSPNIKRQISKFEKKIKGQKFKRTGAIVEYFIYNFKPKGHRLMVDAVCGTSITNNVFDVNIADGIEYCIRNIEAIDKQSIKLYNNR